MEQPGEAAALRPLAEPPAPIGEAAGLYQAGEHGAAAACCLQIVARQPQHFDALHMLGVLACHGRNYADGVSFLLRAAQIRSDVAQLHSNLGNAYAGLRLYPHAEAAYRRALALSPIDAPRLNDLGTALAGADRQEAAEAQYRRALTMRPDFIPARYNLARSLVAQDKLEEAVEHLRVVLDAVAVDPPRQQEVASALAAALGVLGRYEAAAAVCRSVLACQPDAAAAEWDEGLALLGLGHYAEGWRCYEARWRVAAHDPVPSGSAVLDLAQLQGRHVVVLAEQGRGDILQFCRYAPLLAAQGAQVTLQAYADLIPVVETLRDVRVVSLEQNLPATDVITPLMSLPLAFGTVVETIPADVPYLRPLPDRLALWRDRLGARNRPRVGVVWRGRQHISYRSMPAIALAPLVAVRDLEFHALATDITPTDLDWLARHGVVEHRSALADFGDTAALISLMDLVVTIDTASAHLAGALGAPTWVMLAFNADWRWLTGRDDSPWYPTARLFRQNVRGDWSGVMRRVAEALASYPFDGPGERDPGGG